MPSSEPLGTMLKEPLLQMWTMVSNKVNSSGVKVSVFSTDSEVQFLLSFT